MNRCINCDCASARTLKPIESTAHDRAMLDAAVWCAIRADALEAHDPEGAYVLCVMRAMYLALAAGGPA